MALSLSLVKAINRHGRRKRYYNVTFDSSYAAGGEDLTAATMGMRVVQFADATPQTGYVFEYDYSNAKLQAFLTGAGTFTGTAVAASSGIVDHTTSAATIGHALYVVRHGGTGVFTPVAEGSATGLIKHNANAATDGVAIYFVVDDTEFLPNFQLGHLEFVSPTTAHGTCTVFNGGPTLLLEHDASAATNGVQVRATAAGAGLEATIAGSNGTGLVMLSDGQYMMIADATTGGAPVVYFDEDAANTYERLQGNIADTADEPYKLGESTPAIARAGVFGSSRLASLVTVGPGDGVVSQGTVGSGGPEFDVIHDQAAAQMVGAAPLYVQAAGAGFNAALPGGEDVWIPTSTGDFIKVAYAASPSGVQVYWDHDASNSYERFKANVADTADEDYTTDTTVGWERLTPAGTVAEVALGEVDAGTNLSAVVTRFFADGV